MNGENGDWPKISVVTPSFNQGRYIEATIKSVVEQGYPNLEYLIMDGGSTDGTVEIIEKYSDQLTYWVSEPDEGQTDALIKGFNLASGDILCWLCSDDLFEARTLQEVAEIFVKHPDWEVVYGDSFWIDADGRPIRFKREIPYYRFIWMYDHNYLPQPSTFWRRGIYEKVGCPDGTEHGRRPVVPLRRTHRPSSRAPGLVPNALLPRAEEPASAHQERRGGWLDPKSLSARRTPVAPPLEMVPRQRPAG